MQELAKALGKEDGEALEEELLEQLAEAERQQRVDEGVASVLLLAARAQMDSRVRPLLRTQSKSWSLSLLLVSNACFLAILICGKKTNS